MIQKDKVIVLRTIPYSESDLIVRAINSQGSLIGFMAKGARKSKKRFGGGILEPLNYIEVVYKASKNESNENHLYFLNEATLKKDFPGIRKDYDRLETALYMCHVLDKIALEGDINSPAHFHLLGNSLKSIEDSESVLFINYQFRAKLLSLQGILPPDERMNELVQTPIAQHLFLEKLWKKDLSLDIQAIFNQLEYLMNSYLGE